MTTTVGLDISLTSTGIAVVKNGLLVEVGNICSKGKKGDTHHQHGPRVLDMAERINDFLAVVNAFHSIDLAVIEAPSFNSRFGNPHERAGIWWQVYEYLYLAGIDIETLTPPSRAKYITGYGMAKKDLVLTAALARWDWNGKIENDDIADATGLAYWGQERLGVDCG